MIANDFVLLLSSIAIIGAIKPVYDESEALMLLNFAAAAYSNSPELCMQNKMPKAEQWYMYDKTEKICDAFDDSCAGFAIVSDVAKKIIISFRGTNSKTQLLLEGLDSLKTEFDFIGVGSVNHYFYKSFVVIWPHIQPILSVPEYSSYEVSFTGHSLGAAYASLAAAETVRLKMRQFNQVKLITFGQPRVGDHKYAMYHDLAVPYSFRLVHSRDIVPHLPSCTSALDDLVDNVPPCVANETSSSPYHHGTEIWYPHELMYAGAEHKVCLGEPEDEDIHCSDGLVFKLEDYPLYINEHLHYFGVKVSDYGTSGCVNASESSATQTAPADSIWGMGHEIWNKIPHFSW